MFTKWSNKFLLLITELFMVCILIFVCTCENVPVNPYNCTSCRISLMLRSSTLAESDLQIQDSPTKCFQMIANCVMTAYMDSIRFKLTNGSGVVDKDTVVKKISKSVGTENIIFNTYLSEPGVRIANVTAYLNACQPISDSATVVITNDQQNTKPEITIAGSTNVAVNSICTLDVYATDLEQINAQLVYDVSDLPEGASFKNQRFIWKPSKANTYPITFIVTDNGIPSLTSAKTINIVAYVSGIVKSDGTALRIRSGPGVSYDSIGSVADGSTVKIYSQAYGSTVTGTNNITSSIWDHIDGGYVSHVYVYTGSEGLVAPLENR